MNDGSELNFAGRLIRRLGPNSQLINAPDGETVAAAEIQDSVKNAAAALLSAGLQAGDRVLISCGLSPASTLAYLGALYAGLVPVLLEDRSLESIGETLASRTRSKEF